MADYITAVLAGSPAAFWPMQETSGATASDATGGGNDASIDSGVTLGASGPGGGVAMGAFTSGLLHPPTGLSIDTTSSGTVEFWANLSNLGPAQSAFGFNSGGARCQMHFTYSGTVYWDWGNYTNGRPVDAFPGGDIGQWVYVVGVGSDAHTQKALWLNAGKVDSAADAHDGAVMTDLTIGGWAGFNTTAELCCFAVYDRALSDSEIRAHYVAMLGAGALGQTIHPSGLPSGLAIPAPVIVGASSPRVFARAARGALRRQPQWPGR